MFTKLSWDNSSFWSQRPQHTFPKPNCIMVFVVTLTGLSHPCWIDDSVSPLDLHVRLSTAYFCCSSRICAWAKLYCLCSKPNWSHMPSAWNVVSLLCSWYTTINDRQKIVTTISLDLKCASMALALGLLDEIESTKTKLR